jgi:hypothetical protein
MRMVVVLLAGCVGLATAELLKAKDKSVRRYSVEANLDSYPQDTPEKALESVIQAMENKAIDYLVAQLADPDFVDRRVQMYAERFPKAKPEAREQLAFDELVKEVTAHMANDPTLFKELKRISKGEWEKAETAASVSLKDNKEKRVFMRKIGNRWYLENRQTEPEKPKS